MTFHYPDLGSTSDWLKQISQVARLIRSTTLIWKWIWKWEVPVFTFSVTATMFSSAKRKWINRIQGLFKTTTKIQDLFKIVRTMMVTYSFLSQAFFILLLPALGHPRSSRIIIITICCTQTFYFTMQEKIQATV